MKQIKKLEQLRKLAKKEISVLVKISSVSHYGKIEQKFKVRFFSTKNKWKITRLGIFKNTKEYFLGREIKDSIIHSAIIRQGLFLLE